jgi:hypothetical protein
LSTTGYLKTAILRKCRAPKCILRRMSSANAMIRFPLDAAEKRDVPVSAI